MVTPGFDWAFATPTVRQIELERALASGLIVADGQPDVDSSESPIFENAEGQAVDINGELVGVAPAGGSIFAIAAGLAAMVAAIAFFR